MIGGDPNGVPFHVFCYEEWKAKYSNDPPWIKKDYALLATALKAFGGEDYARAAWKAYLNEQDPFYVGHGPGKFVSNMGRWATKQPRQRRDKMHPDDQWAERTRALQRIYQEVNRDATIPEAGKRDEVSRRFKEEFPT